MPIDWQYWTDSKVWLLSLFPSPSLSCSGWRHGPANSSVLCVKRASAERKSSPSTAEGAPAKRTPGTLRVFFWVWACVFVNVWHWETALVNWCFVLQVENPASSSGTENRAREQRGESSSDVYYLVILCVHSICNERPLFPSFLFLQPFQGFGDTGFHMSFGIGAFPFGFFTTVFNTNDPFHRAGTRAHTNKTPTQP